MNHYVGIDEKLSACAFSMPMARLSARGKVASEPDALIAWLRGLKLELTRIGLEAGPLSQWLYAAMRQAGLLDLFSIEECANYFRNSGYVSV